jgi:hypothetical protein
LVYVLKSFNPGGIRVPFFHDIKQPGGLQPVVAVKMENPNDRRSYIFALTSDGRSQVERLQEISTTKIKRVLEKMTDDTLYCLNKRLAALTLTLREEGEANGCHCS